MLTLSFQTAAGAVLQVFLMGLVGYVLTKRGVLDQNGLKLLSRLNIQVFFPLFVFYQFISHFDFKAIPFWWVFPLISFGITLTGLGVASLLLAFRKSPVKNEFKAVIALHNAGHIPLLLAATLPLGSQSPVLYIYIILSLIGFDLSLWSLGVWLLTRKAGSGVDFRNLVNPPLTAMAFGLVLVFLGWNTAIPELITKPVHILGDCALPLIMVTIGGNLAMTRLNRDNAFDLTRVCAAKLIIMPALALLAVSVLRPDPLIGLLIIIQSAVPSAMTLSIIGRHYDIKNQDFVNQAIFFTHLACIITLPVALALYGGLLYGH
ncbi:MAG: AEC family transporter [Candidatus Omnitrophota bacterium]|nr:AEC family transporter [Candidatus Omnitrophota bacterium]